jgi:anthraniloyl-CoA monooxygenase
MSPESDAATEIPPMFTPFKLRELTLSNRVVMSPMCMYSADDLDGTPSDFHIVHLGSRAMGGTGLVFTEMTQVSREARISPGDAGMYDDRHMEAWKNVVDFVHTRTDAKIGMQIGHAGRKACEPIAWKRNTPLTEDEKWEIVAPSAIPFGPDSEMPKEMNQSDIAKVVDDFVSAAKRADAAGFDIIELHAGHGYLLSSFISPLSNQRTDAYGGSLENRMKLPLEVFHAVRAVWPDEKPMSARISAIDWNDNGNQIEDAVEIAKMFKAVGLDIIDVSSGNVTSERRPVSPGLFQTPFSEKIRREADMPTMTVGNLAVAEQINGVIAEGRADLCCVGKGHLFDPYFVRHAARELGYDLKWPNQYPAAGAFNPNPEIMR